MASRSDVPRRSFLTGLFGLAAGALGLAQTAGPGRAASQAKPNLVTYKDASCGCCHKWVEYMQGKGYRVLAQDTDINAVKKRYGIGPELQSCHTTIVHGLIIEGHVPESDIVRFLRERPAGIVGLTIPGMPQSAPGMDVRPFQPYTVLAFDKAGKTSVFTRHTKAES